MARAVDITIRNLNQEQIQQILKFKAEAARQNKTIGEAVNEAFRLWIEHKRRSHMKRNGVRYD